MNILGKCDHCGKVRRVEQNNPALPPELDSWKCVPCLALTAPFWPEEWSDKSSWVVPDQKVLHMKVPRIFIPLSARSNIIYGEGV